MNLSRVYLIVDEQIRSLVHTLSLVRIAGGWLAKSGRQGCRIVMPSPAESLLSSTKPCQVYQVVLQRLDRFIVVRNCQSSLQP